MHPASRQNLTSERSLLHARVNLTPRSSFYAFEVNNQLSQVKRYSPAARILIAQALNLLPGVNPDECKTV